MRLIYVMNPAAGKGRYLDSARRAAEAERADAVHLTEGPGDCTNYIMSECLREPSTHFVVYGGDGTAGEAATGIMRAGAGSQALLTVRPCGSGNDFARGIQEFPPAPGEDGRFIDLISVNGRYVINVMNMGFDCDVVAETERLRRRRQLPNGLSYMMGVGTTMFKKKTFTGKLALYGVTDPQSGASADETLEGEFLLIAAANMPYYGGGFHVAPAADPSDALMDVIAVRDIPMTRFLPLANVYRQGKHVYPETLQVDPRYRDVLLYRRCRTFRFDGVSQICLDGDIIGTVGVHADVVPKALRVK